MLNKEQLLCRFYQFVHLYSDAGKSPNTLHKTQKIPYPTVIELCVQLIRSSITTVPNLPAFLSLSSSCNASFFTSTTSSPKGPRPSSLGLFNTSWRILSSSGLTRSRLSLKGSCGLILLSKVSAWISGLLGRTNDFWMVETFKVYSGSVFWGPHCSLEDICGRTSLSFEWIMRSRLTSSSLVVLVSALCSLASEMMVIARSNLLVIETSILSMVRTSPKTLWMSSAI